MGIGVVGIEHRYKNTHTNWQDYTDALTQPYYITLLHIPLDIHPK